jgi:hypothetical protein
MEQSLEVGLSHATTGLRRKEVNHAKARKGNGLGRDGPPIVVGDHVSEATKMMSEMSTLSESVKSPATVSPTESEIATVAYQLWLDNGCPIGSDQEDWFRAEAMLKSALAGKCEDLCRRPSIPRGDTHTESEMMAGFRWEGHWEIWESEWGGARWVWDLRVSGVEVSNRAGRTYAAVAGAGDSGSHQDLEHYSIR